MATEKIKSQTFSYSPLSRLNTVEVYHLNTDDKVDSAYWILYIHGGAWRDPSIDASSIEATLPHLALMSSQIVGVASLNYRLSPYPHQAIDHSNRHDNSRSASHPDHIEDVMTAISWLQHKYGFGDRYILVGHSAGATLAFQSVTGYWRSQKSSTKYPLADFVAPVAVAGVAGIYDIQKLLESFSSIPTYREFIESAFGKNDQTWHKASPSNADLYSAWTNARLAIVADSNEDQLIDEAQGDNMMANLQSQNFKSHGGIRLKLRGDHDEIWQKGAEMASVIVLALESLAEKLYF